MPAIAPGASPELAFEAKVDAEVLGVLLLLVETGSIHPTLEVEEAVISLACTGSCPIEVQSAQLLPFPDACMIEPSICATAKIPKCLGPHDMMMGAVLKFNPGLS